VWRRLREKRDLVITSSGRPIAVMVEVGEGEDVEATLTALRRVRAQAAISRMRRAAADRGLDRLTADEIDAEIVAARRERSR
jgi:antitoxin (DNA-binding transcriptional repressor) of toxin-antitoxin stability system